MERVFNRGGLEKWEGRFILNPLRGMSVDTLVGIIKFDEGKVKEGA